MGKIKRREYAELKKVSTLSTYEKIRHIAKMRYFKVRNRLVRKSKSVVSKLSSTIQFVKDAYLYFGFRIKLLYKVTKSRLGYPYAVGVRVGLSVELGRVRLVLYMRNGGEYTLDMTHVSAQNLINELQRCTDILKNSDK